MSVIKLRPATKSYMWGGDRLIKDYGIACDEEICAEGWMLSCHPDGPSVIAEGPDEGMTLSDYLKREGMDILGRNCRRFREFPILVKFIDARDNLSIQVHPGNSYALSHEGQYGKTEMWYVMDADEGASIYYGFKREVSLEEFRQRIEDDTLLEVLNKVPAHKGDVFFIQAGTIHAIGKGLLVAEIQQNSNVTYRVYDYGRVGKDGKKRDLHIEKALAVTDREPVHRTGREYPHIADCDYFTVNKLYLDGEVIHQSRGKVGNDSFLSILILDGSGTIRSGETTTTYHKGDSLFLPAGSGDWEITGTCDALLTTIQPKASAIRVGVDLGSGEIRMGLVNDQNHILAEDHIPLDKTKTPEEVIQLIAERTNQLLEANQIPMDQCVGIGVGVPGTIDRKQGTILYSNNIGWRNVPFVEQLGELLPCPVRIGNNADCAALAESICGAAKDYSDVVLLTIGNGVGGGIILHGEVNEGGTMGGGEVGHMVVRMHGRRCTCGRRGCLEAYVSVPALIAAADAATGKSNDLETIFGGYTHGNIEMEEIVHQFAATLGTGIVNVINLYRPQIILLGGKISPWADLLLDELSAIAREDSFGGASSSIPKISTAQLGEDGGIIGAANL